ncbi:MAG: DUF5009 domain-containing protein [Proteobacteria bacterium]|nr:DUF5009 domain-containing protein [Pseudomonadota bacterium]
MANQRYLSLDVFRGATVALMILVNNPGSWSHLYPPLAHAAWHGCTLTDLVFPFFLFAVGNAMAFALPVHSDAFYRHVARRTLWIFGLGLFLNLSPFIRWSDEGELVWRNLDLLRWLGVLQRIGLAYFFSALVVRLVPQRALPIFAAGILLAYWALCLTFGAADDPYSLEGFWGTAVDRALLGANHLYKGEGVPFDPEGMVSTLPCIAQVLIGYLIGRYPASNPPSLRVVARLVVAGLAMILIGWVWSAVMPLNKKIWTSSYVVFTSGWAALVMAALVWLLEIRKHGGSWRELALAFGCNPLFIFCLSGFLPRVIWLLRWPAGIRPDGKVNYANALSWPYDRIIEPAFADPRLGSLVYALAMVAFYGSIAMWMRRRSIFIKV